MGLKITDLLKPDWKETESWAYICWLAMDCQGAQGSANQNWLSLKHFSFIQSH